ncbi:hypothetical protein [Neobacillus dielmonensis]|uniref:hypothetical protein n=1 Tax=Neobacillus dielmonensis TaxID=1347369 RepID=UPI000B2665C2|nr:hypothetical protein [Neobacillus dielmonensis]
MNFQKYELRKISPDQDEYELIFHLHNSLTEFGAELGSKPETRSDLMAIARQVVKERYPAIKITMVKALIGGMTNCIFSSHGRDRRQSSCTRLFRTPGYFRRGFKKIHLLSGDLWGHSLWTFQKV